MQTRLNQTSGSTTCHLWGVLLITHLNTGLGVLWGRVTVEGISAETCLDLWSSAASVPSSGLSGSFHNRGLRGFINSSTGDPGDLTEIPSSQRHSLPSHKVVDVCLQSKNKEAFLFLLSLVF